MELENAATEVVETETDQEVVEPDESPEEGSNYQEVANPESEEEVAEQSHEDNAKFQEYRHRTEAAEKQVEELKRQIEEMEANEKVRNEVYSEYLDDDNEDIEDILADALGVPSDVLNARIEEKAEIERLKAENEKFHAERDEALRREQEARENEELTLQLAEVSKIDPSIKTVEDFENKFAGLSYAPIDYLEKGMTLKQTYFALKSELDYQKRTPPPEVGGVKNEPSEKSYYSKEDVLAMTPEERAKYWKPIRESQKRW